MNTFQECFKIILTRDREASRKAAREVRKLVYSSGIGCPTSMNFHLREETYPQTEISSPEEA